ncbi:MAG TPA: hypothetical protein VE665_08290 [Hyphomicrobiaceae bacterium]|nr:hypothetical protein [Hyphomicrobiaceae bacterium]
MISADLQPDQRPDLWDDHVCVYETVFEPITAEFASQAIARLQLHSHDRVLDVGAGSGGATIALAEKSGRVRNGLVQASQNCDFTRRMGVLTVA